MNDIPHIHGIAVNKANTEQLYLATHIGLFLASPDGVAKLVSPGNVDFTGFAADPSDRSVFYASGQRSGINLGVVRSKDGGKSWDRLSNGINGPVDFLAMDVSKADPRVIYGLRKGLQVSRDGGVSWKAVDGLPDRTIDIAASTKDANTLYAATRKGLYISHDGGIKWNYGYLLLKPTSMVHTAANGTVYAFISGVGLIAADEPGISWRKISNDFQDRTLLHMAVDPSDPDRLYAVADSNGLMTSKDGGKTWTTFENYDRATPEFIAQGKIIFENNCQACHGKRAVGERPENMFAKDEYGFVAPPLDNSAHGWHHSDRGIIATILNGSSRNERMIAWKDILSRDDIESVVSYIKSLWNFNSLACQGVRHMNCGVVHE